MILKRTGLDTTLARRVIGASCGACLLLGPALEAQSVHSVRIDSGVASLASPPGRRASVQDRLPESKVQSASERMPEARPDPIELTSPAVPNSQRTVFDPDMDGDGVPMASDLCPDTQPGQLVDERGCVPEGWPQWMWFVGGISIVSGVLVLWSLGAVVQRRRTLLAVRLQRGGDPAPTAPMRQHETGILARHPFLGLAVLLATGLGTVVVYRASLGADPSSVGLPPPGPSAPVEVTPTMLVPSVATETSREPGERVPARIRNLGGDGQAGRVGRTLPEQLMIRIEDADGVPVPDVVVTWEVRTGGGTLRPDASRTDSSGVAWTLWTLGSDVVRQYAVVHVSGYEDSGLAFEATALPGLATRVTVTSGAGQVAPPGATLDEPIVARVQAAEGEPLEGIEVVFFPEADGEVSEERVVSDAAGLVRTSWTLGAVGDTARLLLRVPESPGVVAVVTAQVDHPPLPTSVGFAAGGGHTCELARAGTLTCWGRNQNGQLGTGSGLQVAAPTPVRSDVRFVSASAGVGHTCAVGRLGRVYCWGDNAQGQLGTGSRAPSEVPRPSASDVRFQTVSAGTGHSCGLTRVGGVQCWGGNVNGQLGDGTNVDRNAPAAVQGAGPYRAVSAGWLHTCALTQRRQARCWGHNAFGQIGDGTTDDRTRPTNAATEARFEQISAGGAHTCALATDGVIHCWGQNRYGQLGIRGSIATSEPISVPFQDRWRAVVGGGVHSCGLTIDGAAFCWGRNAFGQLGDGSVNDRPTPTPVAGQLRFTSIHAGGAHTCGRTTAGRVFCWGYNVEGQLGDGTRDNRLVPTPVISSRSSSRDR